MFYSIQNALPDIEFIWFIRDKDISQTLAERLGLKFHLISTAKTGYVANAWELFITTLKLLPSARSVDLWLSKYGAANIAAWISRTPSISFNDDDISVVPLIALTSYPFASALLAPQVTDMGRFSKKTSKFRSVKELLYLHPKRFKPNRHAVDSTGIDSSTPYALIRLSALTAHHDKGVEGINHLLMRAIIEAIKPYMNIYISSEAPLHEEFEQFRIPVPPDFIHHALYFAGLYVGDSQTMSTEAALLGTPGFRINGFVGEIGVMNWLDKQGIMTGFRPEQTSQFLNAIEVAAKDQHLKIRHSRLCQEFVLSCEDPLPVYTDMIRHYLPTRVNHS